MSSLKIFFSRPRPLDPVYEAARGFSFPSGHSMSAMTFYGLLIYIVYDKVENRAIRWTLICLLSLFIILIGFSRIYLRVHYASDVLAGFALGFIWLVISLWILDKIQINSMKKIAPLLLVVLFSCKKSSTQTDHPVTYEKAPQSYTLTGIAITEASGIAQSKSNPGYLWVEQDSGNPPAIYLLSHDGFVKDSVRIVGPSNRDWEDMALAAGPVPGKNYIYIAELGDNNAVYPTYSFYRFEEPLPDQDEVTAVDTIKFTYPDESHDAEAFLVDNNTKDIYIITKRDAKSKVYRLAYPQSTTENNEAVFVADLDYTGVVSAAISPDGKEIIIKNYTTLFLLYKKGRRIGRRINN